MRYLAIILSAAAFLSWTAFTSFSSTQRPNDAAFMDKKMGCYRGCNPIADSCAFLKEAVNAADIITTEAYATLRHVLPSSLKWVWRKYITHEIKTIPIQVTDGKVTKIAYLNIHGDFCQNAKGKNGHSVLFSHGDYAHPYSMLHLMDIAQNEGHPTFSLYIPRVENTEQFEIHDCLVKEAIDKIESLVKDGNGNFAGILGVGHSKGAILLAQRQFVVLDTRIKATCSIAGRLNVPEDKDCADQVLKTKIRRIYAGILQNSEQSMMQIIPKDDWNASFESMAVRPHIHCYTVPGMHLSGLYSCETQEYFTDFLKSETVD